MPSLLLLGIALLVGFLLFGRWYSTADPKDALKALKWIGIGIFVLIAGFFIFTGRLSWAFFGLPALLPWLMRARAVARVAKSFSRMSQANAGMASGNTSNVETRFFQMTLDHDSGDMSGIIRDGVHSGKYLEDLTTAQLVELLKICQLEDLESARILEAYLDRNRSDWHDFASDAGNSSPNVKNSTMDRAQALQVLGLKDGATDQEIKDTHRKLISGMHPDHGGSDYLAAQINQAKDVLLGS